MMIRPRCELTQYNWEPDRTEAMRRMSIAERIKLGSHAGSRILKILLEYWEKRFPYASRISLIDFVHRRAEFMDDFLCEWPIPIEIES